MEIIGDFQTSLRKALKEIDPGYEKYDGLVVCGSHRSDWDIESILSTIKSARHRNRPTLLICFGHQLGAIEYARNILGIKDATSEEFSSKGTFVIKKRPEMKVGLREGESWWSNYDVAIDYNPWCISVPFHPEYQSSKYKPHPLLVKFLQSCKK